jgi:hypothetical protein
MVISTQKKTTRTSKDRSSYYIKGDSYIYLSKRKGKSLEQIIDKLLPGKNVVFVQEDINDKKIYVIYANSTRDTIVFDLKEHFNISKLVAVLKLAMLHSQEKKIYMLNDSELVESLEEEDFDIELLDKKKFTTIKNKQKYMLKQNAYMFRGAVLIAVLLLIVAMEYVLNSIVTGNLETQYNDKKNDLDNIKKNISKKIDQVETINPNDIKIAQSYREVLEFKGSN